MPITMPGMRRVEMDEIFTKCCICVPLRAGCLLIGYLRLVFCLTLPLFAIYNDYGVRIAFRILSLEFERDQQIIILSVVAALGVMLNIVLLYGIHRDNTTCVLGYLLVSALVLMITILFGFIAITDDDVPVKFKILALDMVVQLYCLRVIMSYNKKMYPDRELLVNES